LPETSSHPQDGRPKYIEPERHDELSTGVTTAARSGGQKRSAGRFTPGPGGSAAQAGGQGGRAHRGRTKLSHRIDASTLTPESQRRARTLRRALAGEIAKVVGGGHCGIAASLFLKFAAQKTAAAEEAFVAGDYETHRKLSESARMDILYAREHAAKEAVALAAKAPLEHDPVKRIRVQLTPEQRAAIDAELEVDDDATATHVAAKP
jgi:hypothetical protein